MEPNPRATRCNWYARQITRKYVNKSQRSKRERERGREGERGEKLTICFYLNVHWPPKKKDQKDLEHRQAVAVSIWIQQGK